MSTNLKECPFCGSRKIGRSKIAGIVASITATDFNHCFECEATGPKCFGRRSADGGWNTRAGREWQPIETAPKDGSKILLYGRCGGLDDYHDYDPTVELGKFWGGSIEGFEDGLWAPISSCPHDLVIDATHWMPLPKPPEVEHD